MKFLALAIAMTLAACSTDPATFTAPAKDSPTWDLNVERAPGTNDLIHPPKEAAQ